MNLKTYYLGHSGFLVDTGKAVLIFDYYKSEPAGGGLADGVIEPEKIFTKDTYIFVTHHHYDHYNPVIWEWKEKFPQLKLILSDDVPRLGDALYTCPNQQYDAGGVKLKTLRSTDEGVAFLVEADGYRIYHAGDLNWWHWDGEPDCYNQEMKIDYQREIDSMGRCGMIDLAFVPVDPRLERTTLWGIDYIMRTLPIKRVIPMHLWEQYDVFDRLEQDEKTAVYRDKIVKYRKRGDKLSLKEC